VGVKCTWKRGRSGSQRSLAILRPLSGRYRVWTLLIRSGRGVADRIVVSYVAYGDPTEFRDG
jgi:hypothetical protein